MPDAPAPNVTPRSCSGKPENRGRGRCGSEATSHRPPPGAAWVPVFGPLPASSRRGSRRVIVKARYTRIVAGDLGAARAHMRYIVRDGVTREGAPGRLYDANGDDADGSAFLDRSEKDPHQFRFVVSADEGARLADLKPFIRDLLSQMERDLDTKLDWVAVDHFNTGHPHTHIVIRGRDRNGEDLVMARDYISHGVRARAQALITLELGPETEVGGCRSSSTRSGRSA